MEATNTIRSFLIETGAPIAEPRVLNAEELAGLMSAVQ